MQKTVIHLFLLLLLVSGLLGCSRDPGANISRNQVGNIASATKKEGGKVLVVYFSLPETLNPANMTQDEENSTVVVDGKVLGNTQYLAYLIQEQTNAALFRIEPKKEYPTDHKVLVNLAEEEKKRNARPELVKKVENMGQYEVIFLGYPTWWGDLPMVLYSFLEGHDLSGKVIIPFNTHGGSGFAGTVQTISKLQPSAKVVRNGFSVSRNLVHSSSGKLAAWLNELGY